MHTSHYLHIYKILIDCMEQGRFETFFPYLADDVKRTSMWYAEDITGKTDVMDYFNAKAEYMAENNHYHATLAYLKYIDGQPSTMAESPKVIATEGSRAGDQFIPGGTKVVLWYPEGEPVVLIRSDLITQKAPTMITLDFDVNGLVKAYNLVNSELYAYEEVREFGVRNPDDLLRMAIQEVALHFHDFGYTVKILPDHVTTFPHMTVTRDNQTQQVSVFTDHAPFIGKADPDLLKYLGFRALDTRQPAIVAFTQLTGLGQVPHRILTTDDYRFTLDRLLDVEVEKAEA